MLKVIQSLLLWTIGGLHFFLIFLIVGGGLLFVDAKTLFPLVRILAWSQLRVVRLRLTVIGLEHFEKGRAYLMLGNHESLFDAFAVPAAIPHHAVGIEAANHFQWPLWGYLTRKWGNIPVNRTDLPRAIKSLQKAEEVIVSGTSVIVLPEGHRTLTGKIGRLKKGPFHLAKAAKADIIPFILDGLYEFNNKHSWHLNPGKATVIFGKPVPYNTVEHLTIEELSTFVKNQMLQIKKTTRLTQTGY